MMRKLVAVIVMSGVMFALVRFDKAGKYKSHEWYKNRDACIGALHNPNVNHHDECVSVRDFPPGL